MNVDVRVRVSVDPGARVFVSGDLPGWNERHALVEVEPGLHCAALRAPPGVVRLRAFIEEGPGKRRWLDTRYLELRVDGAAVELRADDGESFGNTIVTLGGTRGALVFAPDAAHVWCDGRTIAIHAETHGEYGEPPRLELEGVAYALTKVARKGNVRQWRITGVPIGAARDFRIAPDATRFPIAPLVKRAPPPWLTRANVYQVMVDRFHRAADPVGALTARTEPSTPDARYGGDLDGVRVALGALADMGVTAIMLTPVHVAASAHGYDGVDLLTVDERYGGERAFAALITEAHARGVKVIVDFAVTHVHESHAAFLDVVERQGASDKRAWFRGLAERVDPRDPRTFAHYYDRPDLPLLDLADQRPARWHALEAARKWIDRGVDGLRLDAMADAPLSFWRDVRAVAGESVALIGEVVDDRPARFADVLDCVTDFTWRRRALGELDEEAYRFTTHREGPLPDAHRMRFVDNHDLPRVFSLRPREEARAMLASLCAHAGPIAVTAGTELGLSGGPTDPARAQRLDDVWPDRVPMPLGEFEADAQLARMLRERSAPPERVRR